MTQMAHGERGLTEAHNQRPRPARPTGASAAQARVAPARRAATGRPSVASRRPRRGASGPGKPAHTRPAQTDLMICKNDPALTSIRPEIHKHYLYESRILHLEPYTRPYSHFLTFTSSSRAEEARDERDRPNPGHLRTHP